MTSLAALCLSGTPVEDLTPLAEATSLLKLDLGNAKVSDLTPLSGLSGLETLSVRQPGGGPDASGGVDQFEPDRDADGHAADGHSDRTANGHADHHASDWHAADFSGWHPNPDPNPHTQRGDGANRRNHPWRRISRAGRHGSNGHVRCPAGAPRHLIPTLNHPSRETRTQPSPVWRNRRVGTGSAPPNPPSRARNPYPTDMVLKYGDGWAGLRGRGRGAGCPPTGPQAPATVRPRAQCALPPHHGAQPHTQGIPAGTRRNRPHWSRPAPVSQRDSPPDSLP